MEKERELALSILEHVGGRENLLSLHHCMTRLRLTPKKRDSVDLEKLKGISGVMGVVEQSGQLQIILGPGVVNKVTRYLTDETGMEAESVEDLQAAVQDTNRTPFKLFLRKLANIFIPLIPAIVAGGLISGITGIIVYTLDVSETNQWIQLLNAISSVIFFYLSVFVGINTAREFGGTPALGGVAGGLLYLPAIAEITLFGDKLIPGRGGLIGVLLAAWFISVVEKQVRKRTPAALDIIVTPAVSLLITGLATYAVLQPVGGYISDGITNGLTSLLNAGGAAGSAVSGAVLAGTFLPLVITGLHHGLTPIHMDLLAKTGLDPLLPILAMGGAGQVGAAFAVYLKTRNQTLRNVIKGGLPVGILGIGEPLIFGVTLPLGRTFITACLGAAVGGTFQSVLNIASIAIGVSGLPLALLIKTDQIFLYVAGVLIAYVAGFAFTWLFGYTKEMDQRYGTTINISASAGIPAAM
jgi:sucrose PTS system EIIBCA or EIIBC component